MNITERLGIKGLGIKKKPDVKTSKRSQNSLSGWKESRNLPPVMVRGTGGGVYARARTVSPKVKKIFDIPLPNTNAEIRVPGIPAITMGWRWLSITLSILLIILILTLWNSPVYQIRSVEVKGLSRITNDQLEASMGLTASTLFSIDSQRIRNKILSSYPEFSDVKVSVNFPNKIGVSVVERIPLFTWIQAGKTNLVDVDGVSFPLRTGLSNVKPVVEAEGLPTNVTEISNDEPVSIPTITSSMNHRFTQEMVVSVMVIASQAPSNTPLLYDPIHGFGWKDPEGWKVYFGNTDDIALKLLAYNAIVYKLKDLKLNPKLISVEHLHAPYFKLEY